MKLSTFRWRLLMVGVVLISIAASSATLKDYKFDVNSTYGDRDSFNFTATESGCIVAKITSWSPSTTGGSPASELALILNGSDRTDYYARKDGGYTSIVPLWTSYSVTSDQVDKVKQWTISVVNFTKKGTAKGTLNLEYPPTKMPCEFKITISRTKGQLDLSWVYTGKSFRGSFLVERTTDNNKWSVISACSKTAPSSSTTKSTSYSCSNTGLTSKAKYYYRACAITSGSVCGTSNRTPALNALAP